MASTVQINGSRAKTVTLMPVNMLWVGPSLGRIEQLSITSFLSAGHSVKLHTYGEIANLPQNVEISDAALLMPFAEAKTLRHRQTGSFALASDLFRYRLMAAGEGLWSDTDVVCLRPIDLARDHIFGWENKRNINGALLYLTKNSPLLADLLKSFRASYVPPWLSIKRALPFHAKRLLRQGFGPADLPWGAFGPRALTYLAHRHGLAGHALRREALYPLALRDAARIFEPGFSLPVADMQQAFAIHLWNEALGPLKGKTPPAGSLLFDLCRRFGV
jgi:hypothetical protein